MKFYVISIIVLFCFVNDIFAQSTTIDSLRQVYSNTQNDSVRIKLLNEDFGNEFRWINSDSAIFYYKKALEISDKNLSAKDQNTKIKNKFLILKATSLRYIGNIYINQGVYKDALLYYEKALKINNSLQDKKGMSSCNSNIGIVYSNLGEYEKSLEYYQIALKINEEINDKNGISLCYTNIGVTYSDQGIYDKALEYYFKALKIEGLSGNKKRISACYSNIGIVYKNLKSYDKALEYYKKALHILEEIGDLYGLTQCYTNIGNIYYSNLEFDKSLENYQKVLKITKEIGDQYGESASYTNIGNVCYAKGNYKECLEYYLRALQIKSDLDDKQGIALLYENIASVNISLADSSVESKNQKTVYLNRAIEYGEKAIQLAQEINIIPVENSSANTLMEAYRKKGDFVKSLQYADIFIATKDSMFKEDKTKAIAEMETKYQSEKKQLEIDKLAKEKELQASEMKKQQLVILFVACGLLFVLGFSVVLFRLFLQKKKANKIITEKNDALQIAYSEINTQKEEIMVQRDNIQAQKEIIEEHQKEIEDSINYAKSIQQAVMPNLEFGIWNLEFESFILFKPKDIVSGDFYWTTKINEWFIVTVADCTGHGVPGAFMSMLGISFLNEIVRKKEVTRASEVLDQLRASVIDALKQKGESGEQKDGMDIGLCVINVNTKEMQFAGANNPCWIVSHLSSVVSPLIELKPDKQPIGIHTKMIPFTNQLYQLKKGDIIYLMSDGYEDQFGGPNRKKFLSKNLKKLLIENYDLSMPEQKQKLETTITKWTGDYEQIDDITVLGLRT